VTEWRIEVEWGPRPGWDEDSCHRVLVGLVAGGAIDPECDSDGAATYLIDAASFTDALRAGPSIWLAALERAALEPRITVYHQRPGGYDYRPWPPRDWNA
jgi:hypothetical protein